MKNKIIKNIPNMITISRISASFLACIMFILGNFPVSLGFYVYAACSDAVDGYFARKLNATSELGRKLDAISDKLFVLSLICAKGTLSHKEVEYTTIYVESGDTLWNIASDLQQDNNYYKNKDIRYIIDNIKKINNLESSNLYIDQELKIPIA